MSSTALVLLVYASSLLAGLVATARLYPAPVLPSSGVPTAPVGGARPLGWTGLFGRALVVGPGALAVTMGLLHVAGVRFSIVAVLAPWWAFALLSARPLARALGASLRDRPPAEHALGALAFALFAWTLWVGLFTPVHASDALHNFALNARVFESYGSLAPDVLRDGLTAFGRIEYPPLVALNEALVFLAAGDERALAIKPLFALAQLGFLLLVAETFAAELDARFAVPGALLFLLVPVTSSNAVQAFGDVVLMASVMLLALEARALFSAPGARGAWRFALWAGLCALTKNEGVALAVGAACALVFLGARRRLRAGTVVGSLALLVALAGAWPAFKLVHGIRDAYLADAAGGGAWTDVSRLATVLAFFAESTVGRGGLVRQAGLAWPVALLAACAAFASARGVERRRLACVGLALGAHVALYALVFLATPHQLDWHLHTAAGRLLMHPLPWLALLWLESLRALGGAVERQPLRAAR